MNSIKTPTEEQVDLEVQVNNNNRIYSFTIEPYDPEISNVHDVMIGDFYYLLYDNKNVVFQVCGVNEHYARIYELQLKDIDNNRQIVHPKLIPARKPIIIKNNNCWRKSTFWAETGPDYITVNNHKAYKINETITKIYLDKL